SFSSASSMSVSTSFAPLACRRRATSAPTPFAPPVISATFPFTEPMAVNVLHRVDALGRSAVSARRALKGRPEAAARYLDPRSLPRFPRIPRLRHLRRHSWLNGLLHRLFHRSSVRLGRGNRWVPDRVRARRSRDGSTPGDPPLPRRDHPTIQGPPAHAAPHPGR